MKTSAGTEIIVNWGPAEVHLETAEEYHDRREQSTSKISDLIWSPEYYQRRHITGEAPPESTDAMDIGSSVHEDVLLDVLEHSYIEIPPEALTSNGQRRGKNWEYFKEANPGKRLLLPKHVQLVERCRQSIEENPTAAELIFGTREGDGGTIRAQRELTVISQLTATGPEGQAWACGFRGRLDYLPDNAVVDLKTTSNGSIDVWPYAAKKYGYDMQAAAYRKLAELIDGRERQVFFVVVETQEPYRCDVWEASEQTLAVGWEKLNRGIVQYMERAEVDDWLREYWGEILKF